VVHYTQILEELILSGKVKFKNAVEKTVAFHDPCFLGRYNDIYEPPRNVLKAIPGLKLVEITPNRSQAECCGGGGGGNWMALPAGERVSERRLRQAIETGAEIIAVACPHCLLMFEEAIKSLGCEGQVEVKQVIELIHQAI
jgi:Fe-S oxidoreductase